MDIYIYNCMCVCLCPTVFVLREIILKIHVSIFILRFLPQISSKKRYRCQITKIAAWYAKPNTACMVSME